MSDMSTAVTTGMQVWDLNRGLTRGSFPIASSCNALAVSLDGALLVSPCGPRC